MLYITKAAGALAIRDERGAAKALRSLVELLQANTVDEEGAAQDAGTAATKILTSLTDTLPDPTPTMQRAGKLGLLLGIQGASSLTAATASGGNAAADAASTLSKFVPLLRKLAAEPRVTDKANEVVARLSERLVSRSLRAVFRLPPPVFADASESASD